jgi:uncharacterized membrane protein
MREGGAVDTNKKRVLPLSLIANFRNLYSWATIGSMVSSTFELFALDLLFTGHSRTVDASS